MSADGGAGRECGRGRYRLDVHLGSGSFGEVWMAQDVITRRLVAVKLLPSAGVSRPDFEREIESQSKLHHPNIVEVFDAGTWDEDAGDFYIAMHLVSGSSLQGQLGKESLRDPRSAVRLISMLARAIEHAHERNVLHCDLKPGNILLDEHSVPLLCDFGLACMLERHAISAGASLPYMAPEQCGNEDGRAVALNRWTDVFGLGAVLYKLLTDETPYPATTIEERRQAFGRPNLQPPSVVAKHSGWLLGEHLDADLDTVCMTALAVNPYQRYGSARAFADDLERWLCGEPIRGPQTNKVPSLPRRLRSWLLRLASRTPRSVIALALFAVLLLPLSGALIAATVAHSWLSTTTHELARAQGFYVNELIRRLRLQHEMTVQNEYVAEELISKKTSVSKLVEQHTAADPLELGKHEDSLTLRHRPDWELSTFDLEGCGGVRWPALGSYAFEWWGFRDYFKRAKRSAANFKRDVSLSRVFRSYPDGKLRVGLASAVYNRGPNDHDQRPVGIFVATLPVNDLLGDLRHQPSVPSHQTTSSSFLLSLLHPFVTAHTTTALLGFQDVDREKVLARGTQPTCAAEQKTKRDDVHASDEVYAYSYDENSNSASRPLNPVTHDRLVKSLNTAELPVSLYHYREADQDSDSIAAAYIFSQPSATEGDGIFALVVSAPFGPVVSRIVCLASAFALVSSLCFVAALVILARRRE